jgi:hypothetical protein
VGKQGLTQLILLIGKETGLLECIEFIQEVKAKGVRQLHPGYCDIRRYPGEVLKVWRKFSKSPFIITKYNGLNE